jgi:hypothetical protein
MDNLESSDFYLGNDASSSKILEITNFTLSYEDFIFVLSDGTNSFTGDIPADPIEEALGAVVKGYKMGRSMGVEQEDLYRISIYIKRSDKDEIIKNFIRGLLIEIYSTGYIADSSQPDNKTRVPLGTFPIVQFEIVNKLYRNLNVVILFEFSDFDNTPNDGKRHFELGSLLNIIAPKDVASSSYAIVKGHLFSSQILRLKIDKLEKGVGWYFTDNIGDAWDILLKKSQFLGASFNQLGYITIQMDNLDKQLNQTLEIIKNVYGNGPYPALDIYEGDQYSLTPEWYFGNGIPQSFTNKKTVYYYPNVKGVSPIGTYSSAVRIGEWIKTSSIFTNNIENIELCCKRPFYVRIRIVDFVDEDIDRVKKLINKFDPKPILMICSAKKLPKNYKFSVVFEFSQAEFSKETINKE